MKMFLLRTSLGGSVVLWIVIDLHKQLCQELCQTQQSGILELIYGRVTLYKSTVSQHKLTTASLPVTCLSHPFSMCPSRVTSAEVTQAYEGIPRMITLLSLHNFCLLILQLGGFIHSLLGLMWGRSEIMLQHRKGRTVCSPQKGNKRRSCPKKSQLFRESKRVQPIHLPSLIHSTTSVKNKSNLHVCYPLMKIKKLFNVSVLINLLLLRVLQDEVRAQFQNVGKVKFQNNFRTN